jgi:SHS2 domain-containing protein
MNAFESEAGFRLIDHTADLIVEAWGPTREHCLEEAVRGLVASFAEIVDDRFRRHDVVHVAGSDTDRLVALLEEVVVLADETGAVPAEVRSHHGPDVSKVDLWLVDEDAVRPAGAAPKGIARSGLMFVEESHGWRCRVTIDV